MRLLDLLNEEMLNLHLSRSILAIVREATQLAISGFSLSELHSALQITTALITNPDNARLVLSCLDLAFQQYGSGHQKKLGGLLRALPYTISQANTAIQLEYFKPSVATIKPAPEERQSMCSTM